MKKITSIILFLIFINCNSQLDKNNDFEQIIKHEKIFHYFHSELLNRQQLYLVKNDFVNYNGKVNNITIKTIDLQQKNKYQNIIKICNVIKDKDLVKYILEYPIEGLYIEVYFRKNKIIKTVLLEKKID